MIKIRKLFLCIFLFSSSFGIEKNIIEVINFNIHGFNGKNIYKKVSNIIDNIKDFDIILIQENWRYKEMFVEKLKDYMVLFDDNKKKRIFSSGLTIALKNNIKLIAYDKNNFISCNGYIFNGNDCLATKGYMYSKINYNGNILSIYNTHLDSGNSYKDRIIRKTQLEELKEYIIKNSSNEPILISGDFNIDFMSDEGKIIKNFMIDLDLNKIDWDSNYFLKNKIDYIFYRGIHSNSVNINDTLYSLSDHPPMGSIFNFIK